MGLGMAISTHTLTWSVTELPVESYLKYQDFNSHAHVERDFRRHFSLSFLTISTHTLTWSVTVFTRSEAETFRISTHTLTWSVTFEECMWTLTP